MNPFKLLLIVVALLASITGCTARDDVSPDPSVSQANDEQTSQIASQLPNEFLLDGIYSDDHLTFTYSKGWEKQTIDTSVGPLFMLFATGGGGINWSCLTQELPESEAPVTLAEYTEASREDFGTQVSDPKITAECPITIGGQPAYERTWQGIRIDGSGVVFEYQQAWSIVGNKAFLFTLCGPADELEAFKPAAQSIVESVQFRH